MEINLLKMAWSCPGGEVFKKKLLRTQYSVVSVQLLVHGCMLYTERAKMAAVSCGTSHASAVSTLLWWTGSKMHYKKLFTHVESHASAVSLLESGE